MLQKVDAVVEGQSIISANSRPEYLNILEEIFKERRLRNNRYSLRAFARDLNMNPSTLSAVMNSKRPFPAEHMEEVCERLNLTESEEKNFNKSIEVGATNLDKIGQDRTFDMVVERSEPKFDKLRIDPRYRATLGLISIAQEKGRSVEWMAKKLELPLEKVQETLDDLVGLGIVEVNLKGTYKRIKQYLIFAGGTDAQITEERNVGLGLALKNSQNFNYKNCYSRNMTLAVNINDIPKVKKLITDFRYKMRGFLKESSGKESSGHDEVYNFEFHFFPLTDITID